MLSPRVLIHLLLVRPLVRLFFGVNAAGCEHLAAVDQCIIIANHNSHLDVPLIFSVLPVRRLLRTHPVAAREYFARWRLLFRVLDYLFRPIWIVRGDRAGDPLKEMKERLESGDNIIIFPEGTRGSPGELIKFQSGVGMLAVAYPRIPIVPVFLLGPERAFPRTCAVPLPLWNEVTVGPPQVFTGTRRDITAALEHLVRDLGASAAANRHRRRKRPKPPYCIAVLGIDGSGKSTLARALAQRLSDASSVCLVTDGLERYQQGGQTPMQPLPGESVREAVGRYAKTANSLKHYKVPKLAELLLRDHIMGEVARWYTPEIVVLDGSPVINLAAWANLYKEDCFNAAACATALRVLCGQRDARAAADPVFTDFPELAALKRLHLTNMRLPDAVILLDVDPALSVERIARRGEARQVHETEEKLAKLRRGYRLVCNVVQTEFGIPARILDGGAALDALAESAVAFIAERRAEETDHE